jgi:excisionase family DNA binding protein
MAQQLLQQDTNESPLLTVAKVASRLAVHPATVTRLVHRGDLGAIRVGGQLRVSAADLAAYLDRQRVCDP